MVTQTTDDRLMEPLLAHLFVLVAHRFHPDFAFEIAFGVLRLLVVHGFQARRQAMLQGLKKPVVPIHNGPATSPIGPQHLIVQGLVKGALGVCKGPLLVVHDVRQMQQLSVVAVSPAVNRLFSIADHQGAVAFGEDVVDQGNEVLPLGDRRVLEFIHKHMPVAASQPLKQKRYWVVAHHTGDPVVQGMKRSDVSGFLNPFHLLGDEGQRSDQIHFVQKPFPKNMGLSSRSSRNHVPDLLQDVFRIRRDARDGCDRCDRCRSGREDPLVEHAFQVGRRCHCFSAPVFLQP